MGDSSIQLESASGKLLPKAFLASTQPDAGGLPSLPSTISTPDWQAPEVITGLHHGLRRRYRSYSGQPWQQREYL